MWLAQKTRGPALQFRSGCPTTSPGERRILAGAKDGQSLGWDYVTCTRGKEIKEAKVSFKLWSVKPMVVQLCTWKCYMSCKKQKWIFYLAPWLRDQAHWRSCVAFYTTARLSSHYFGIGVIILWATNLEGVEGAADLAELDVRVNHGGIPGEKLLVSETIMRNGGNT